MARMYPRTLDESEVKSKAELKVFDALRDQLDDDWEAYHSVSWMIRDPAEGARDGEIDFVLCHPERGILCLEVKGGGLECRHGNWFRLVGGKRESMKDPFTQALDHCYDLQRKISEQKGWKHRKLFICHGLAFTDISVHKLVLGPDAPAEIIIDRNSVKDLPAAMERILGYHTGAREKREMPGEEGAKMLRELLAPEVCIRVPMAAEFLEEQESLIALTLEQAKLLARWGNTPRVAVCGCAGSGKTVLAVEQAKRLERAGKDVLFICFNRRLRDHLRKRERNPGVTFQTFHGFCMQQAKQAGVELTDYPPGEAPPEFFSEELPYALVQAVEGTGPQFDALIVDEAQDLNNDWLDALILNLRDREEGFVWLFMDDNQRVYDSDLEIPKGFFRYDLTVNCRNTQAIHNEVVKKYEGSIEPEVLGPPGRDVDLLQTDDQAGTVAAVVQRLCGEEEVVPQDIVILSSHGIENSSVASAGRQRLLLRGEPSAGRPAHPLLIDPRLQGPRVPGGDPLRAGGPRPRDDGPAALRRHLEGQEPLRRGGAEGRLTTCWFLNPLWEPASSQRSPWI